MNVKSQQHLEFIRSVDLNGTPRGLTALDVDTDAGEIFDSAKEQAQVVGSSVLSFAVGVDPAVREAISNSALLAQLVANKQAGDSTEAFGWFKAYAAVLQNIGWVLQDGVTSQEDLHGSEADVNEALITLITAVMSGAGAAIDIVKATLDALDGMGANNKWFTIFNRQSTHAQISRFQIGLVNKGENDDVLISLVAFMIEAQSDLTQVLFFKFHATKVHFASDRQQVSVNRDALADTGPAIRAKIRAYIADYVSSIVDIPPPPHS